jgi:cytochrome c5
VLFLTLSCAAKLNFREALYVKAFKHAAITSLTAGFVALSLTAITANADHNSDHSIIERISKVGSLCVEGQECKAPVAAAAPVASGPRSGADVYNTACAACHGTGAAGAPKMGDTAAWGPRINKGLDTLLANAINGINGMPPRGLCMDCSDDELKEAVEHMVNGSK